MVKKQGAEVHSPPPWRENIMDEKKKQRRLVVMKQIAIDVNAFNILQQVKEELNKTGRSTSHSDAIRAMYTHMKG